MGRRAWFARGLGFASLSQIEGVFVSVFSSLAINYKLVWNREMAMATRRVYILNILLLGILLGKYLQSMSKRILECFALIHTR
jgi:hypothetical protein